MLILLQYKYKERPKFPEKLGFEISPYGSQLILEIKDPEKGPFEASGSWHLQFAGARKTLPDMRRSV